MSYKMYNNNLFIVVYLIIEYYTCKYRNIDPEIIY